jgi:hypothetical protein
MAKGQKTGGGSRKGIPNKLSGIAKENVIEVFNSLDGTAGMAEWASENKTEFYKIYARLLPTDAAVEHSGTVGFTWQK